MKRTVPDSVHALIPPIFLILALLPLPVRAGIDSRTRDAMRGIEEALGATSTSERVWPSWNISETAVALLCPDGTCYLINHPDPPQTFDRVDDAPIGLSLHRSAISPSADTRACDVAGVPTAMVRLEDVRARGLAGVFEAAFEAYESEGCPEITRPVVLVSGYPTDAQSLALADMECELLEEASGAPDDSLVARTAEYLSVRRYRQMLLTQRLVDFERRLEFTQGIPAYVAARCREEQGEESRESPWTPPADTLASRWYKWERFGWTGERACRLLDRLRPEWKVDPSNACEAPSDVLMRQLSESIPAVGGILEKRGLEERVTARGSGSGDMKTEAERHFEELVGARELGGPRKRLLSISTHLLVSGEVAFEPASVERVDDHRTIHNRMLRVEYSWGTRFESVGLPVAAIVGNDDFDLRKLIVRLPDDYSIKLDGRERELEYGVYQFEESMVFEANGLTIEAHAGTVMVGQSGISIILHR